MHTPIVQRKQTLEQYSVPEVVTGQKEDITVKRKFPCQHDRQKQFRTLAYDLL